MLAFPLTVSFTLALFLYRASFFLGGEVREARKKTSDAVLFLFALYRVVSIETLPR